jgi:hypothetical protein
LKTSRAIPSGSTLKNLVGLFIVTLGLGACAGRMPVPGGSDSVNQTCFTSVTDMQARVAQMSPGMPEGAVLAGLCRKKESMSRLDRREIRIALLGGTDVLFSEADAETDAQIIRSLYGYKFAYTSLNRRHGFKSPIRIQTDETGYDYTITLIFRDGVLFEKPILSGGLVNKVSSGTIFDFITPGTIVNAGLSH